MEKEESEEEIKKELKASCQLCTHNEHRYKCPRCLMLTCSLSCSKEHKSQFACSGKKDHVSSLNVRMHDFTLGTLRKDMKFMDDAIMISNTSKKRALLEPN